MQKGGLELGFAAGTEEARVEGCSASASAWLGMRTVAGLQELGGGRGPRTQVRSREGTNASPSGIFPASLGPPESAPHGLGDPPRAS